MLTEINIEFKSVLRDGMITIVTERAGYRKKF
jgi:hypothetical protein